MVAQQLLGLVQQLAFVLRARVLIPPPQPLQNFFPCLFTHRFIHSGHGNNHFWRNVSFSASLPPLPGNNTFGAIRRQRNCAKGLAPPARAFILVFR
jgi:hypothetical protein